MTHALRNPRIWALVLVVALLAITSSVARGTSMIQDDPPPEMPEGSVGQVDISVLRFGVGGRARAGDWVGVLVEVQYFGTTQGQTAMVQMAIPDADGDTMLAAQPIPLQPGVKRRLWLYGRLPFKAGNGDYMQFTAVAIPNADRIDGRSGLPEAPIGSPKILGRYVHRLSSVVAPTEGLIGKIGQRSVGIDAYLVLLGERTREYPENGHELTDVFMVDPVLLPDRWMGLSHLDIMVWNGSGPNYDPLMLDASRAQAVREWVMRGGHLVVVIPPIGQSWLATPRNPLADLMPRVSVERRVGVDLDQVRHLITRNARRSLPSVTAHVMVPAQGARLGEAEPILTLPDGEVIAMRRTVGAGAVTVVGLDIGDRALGATGIVDPELFWNRVLGKRRRLWSTTELTAMRDDSRNTYSFPIRQQSLYDEFVAGVLRKQGRAALGVLLAFVVFGSYWLLSGPIAYVVLKKRERKHHSWVVFTLVTAIFTAVTWGGATLLKPGRLDAKHMTILDAVHGQPVNRARAWISAFLPDYGTQRVAIDSSSSLDGTTNALTPWESPDAGFSFGKFPDARGYRVDCANPSVLAVPTRSTVKQFQADWLGQTDWEVPFVVLPDGADPLPVGRELGLTINWTDAVSNPTWDLTGSLRHNLPGTLSDVYVIVCLGQSAVTSPPTGFDDSRNNELNSQAFAFTVKQWEPGELLKLDLVTGQRGLATELRRTLDGDLLQGATEFDRELGRSSPRLTPSKRMLALSLYDALGVPDFRARSQPNVVQRRMTHGYDLSRWLTQPSLIVIGVLESGPSPVPMTVDGRKLPTEGMTVVRWVYPFPPSPPAYVP